MVVLADRLGKGAADADHVAAGAAARNHLAFVAEEIFGDVPAAVDLADELRLGHFDIVEEGFAEGRIARNQQDRLGRDALALHVEEHEGDALIFVRLVGADEAEDPVGLVGIAGPDLRSVDDPVIALVLAEGLQGDEVAARAGFRIALAPADFTARDLVQIMDLLLFGPEFEQRGAEHPDTEAVERRARVDALHFLFQDLGLFGGQPGAAIFLRPIGNGVALCGAGFEPLFLGVILENPFAAAPAHIAFVADGFAHFGGTIGFQPGAHFGAKSVLIAHFSGSSSGVQTKGSRPVYASVNLAPPRCRYGTVASDCGPLTRPRMRLS